MALVIEAAPTATDEVRTLVGELEEVLSAEYPPEQRHGLAIDAIFQPHVRFFVARKDGEAIGCGGVALFDGFAEVKRMYVRPSARGSGAAQAILAQLETTARAAGQTLLQLETGTRQLAAIKFYEGAGFQACGAFGPYARMDAQAIATSLFYEKRI
jgi:putative acetyltransferase